VLRVQHAFSDRFISCLPSRNGPVEERNRSTLQLNREKGLARTLLLPARYGKQKTTFRGAPRRVRREWSLQHTHESISPRKNSGNCVSSTTRKQCELTITPQGCPAPVNRRPGFDEIGRGKRHRLQSWRAKPYRKTSIKFLRHEFAWILCFIWLTPAPGARACACSQVPPGACQGLQKVAVAFLGTLTDSFASPTPSGAPTEATHPMAPLTRYHFHIDESFAGPEEGDIDVFSGSDTGDCGYRFKKGEQYIVFTQQDAEGRLFATICNGTRPASDGRALLPQMRAMRNGQRVASVFGVLRRTDPPFLAASDDSDDSLSNIALKLRSRDDRFSTSTGPGGIYAFYDVPIGEYHFTANLPVPMVLTQKALIGGLRPFKIPNGACFEYDVDALPAGHIRGSVLGPDGKPLTVASVELYRAAQYSDTDPDLWRLWGFQGSKGYFDFDHIGPGDYIIVYNRMNRIDPNLPFPRSFYPGTSDRGDAETIRLKDGQQLLKADIKVHAGYPTRPLRVLVNWEHGQPTGTLTVIAKADDGTPDPAAQKIGDGVFEFTLLQSRHYTVSGWEDLDPQPRGGRRGSVPCVIPARIDADSVTVDASNADAKEVKLTFAMVECAEE